MVQKRRHVLWAKAHLKWIVSKWKRVLWSDESKFDILFGNYWHLSSVLKRRETFQHVISVQLKSQHLWWYGVHKCIQYGQLACFGKHYECWKEYKGFRATMLPSRRCVFSQDNAKPNTATITTVWLHSRRVQVLNWPACSTYLSPIENFWCIIKLKIRQKWPRTLQQLETYIRQEWDQIPTPKLYKLITSMPRRL